MGFEPQEYIRESNAIEDVHEKKAVHKSMEAWEYLKRSPKLNNFVIKRTHELIMEDRQPDIAGEYRYYPVRVGNHVPECKTRQCVKDKMNELLRRDSPETLEEVIQWHVDFETIHPFGDGNGRVGRMIAWWQALNIGENPPLWTEDKRQEYYSLFTEERES